MDLRILGPVTASDKGSAVPLGGPRQRAALALLVLQANNVVSTDRLLEDLYGEDPPAAARKSLQSFMANLRREINTDAEILIGRRPGYVIETDSRHIDALHFEDLCERARRVLREDPVAARTLLTEALSLWRGPPLADVASQSAVLEWEALRLDNARLDAVEMRIEADLATGERSAIVPELELLVAEHPLRERFWAQLMLALYGAGRQADALRTYQRARTTLGEELGIEPAPELADLENQILLQDPDLGPVLADPAPLQPGNRPQPGRAFHGYEIRRSLGADATGNRYLAYQPTLGRQVVITALSPVTADDPEYVRRFEANVQRLGGLNHPAIAPLTDAWRHPGGAFLVTRWAGELTLADRLTEGRLTLDEIADIAQQLGSALVAAHRLGIAHGCLDPDHVVLTDAGAILTGFTITAGDPDPADDLIALDHLLRLMVGEPVPPEIDAALRAAPAGDAAEYVSAVLPAISPDTDSRTVGANPYRGLQPFDEGDAHLFYGRTALTNRLVDRLAGQTPLVAVVGPSGSGKSSVIRAGLVPALRAGTLPGSAEWYVTVMVPGSDPFGELGSALTRIAAVPIPDISDLLRNEGLASTINAAVGPDATVLLVIDQFEELYTQTLDPDRAAFLDLLADTAVDPAAGVRVVIGLRADYYDRPLIHPRFGEVVSAATEPVTQLSTAELEGAIAEPARHAGLRVDTGLDARIIADVIGRPGGLPLLQHALSELYEHRDGSTLTTEAYEATGGVDGALARRAEDIYQSLTPQQQTAARQIMLRMITADPGGQATRTRARRSELDSLGGSRFATAAVIDGFAAHRLLSLDRDPTTGTPIIELAHEALMTAWPRFRSWIEANRADLALRQRLDAAVSEWRSSDGDPSYLLSGGRLAQFEEWAATTSLPLSPLEASYLSESTARRDAEAAAETQRIAHERTLEIRSRRRLRILVGVMAIAVAAVSVLALIARRQTANAERNLAISESRRLTAEAAAAIAIDPELAVLLALEAVGRTESVGEPILAETVETLHSALPAMRVRISLAGGSAAYSPDGSRLVATDPGTSLSQSTGNGDVTIIDTTTWEPVAPLVGHGTRTSAAAYSPDGTLITTGDFGGTAIVWEAATGDRIATLDTGPGLTSHIGFHPDGSELLTVNVAGLVKTWSPEGAPQAEFSHAAVSTDAAYLPGDRIAVAVDDPGHGVYVWSDPDTEPADPLPHPLGACAVEVNADGTVMATGGSDGIVRLWDVATMGLSLVLEGHGGRVCGIAFTPDGSMVVSASEDGTARLWDVATGEALLTLAGHAAGVEHVAISPDGRNVATGSGDGTTRIWDISAEGSREVLTVAADAPAVAAAFDPNGARIAASFQDGIARIWDAATGTPGPTLLGHTSALWKIAFSPDGSGIVTVGQDGTARLWETATGAIVHALQGHTDQVFGAAFSPDGQYVFTSGFDSTIRAWDSATGTELGSIATGGRGVFGIDLTSDGAVLAAGGDAVTLWNSATGAPLHEIDDIGISTAVMFTADDSMLLTGGVDGAVRLWSLDAGSVSLVNELGGHNAAISSIESDAAGTLIITASSDGVVKVRDPDGSERFAIPGLAAPGIVDVSPDGTRLAIPDADGTVRLFLLDPDALVDLAESRPTRTLSDDECRRYLGDDACP